VPDSLAQTDIDNCIGGNYSGGVFLPCDGLQLLRADYESDPAVRAAMDEKFSDGRLPVFWLATDAAIDANLGLVDFSH